MGLAVAEIACLGVWEAVSFPSQLLKQFQPKRYQLSVRERRSALLSKEDWKSRTGHALIDHYSTLVPQIAVVTDADEVLGALR